MFTGITFALLVTLAYPDGHEATLRLGEGLSKRDCVAGAWRAVTQLPATLSVAKLVNIDCKREIGA